MSAPQPGPSGILLVDKSPGWTSHDVVGRARFLLRTKKVGHAGTLDPMATGLLVLGIGQGTRLLTHLVGLPKTYEATIRLGRATTTDDAEGEALGEAADASGLADDAIERALDAFRGEISQVPSTVSAIKVDGQRAYARVRAGETVELAARPVTVSRLDVRARRTEGAFTDLDVVVDCSSGTYIRALARDLGAALGVGGHLTALRRTRVGPFDVADAETVPPRDVDDDVARGRLPRALQGLGAAAARVLPVIDLDEQTVTDLGHGKRIAAPAGAGAEGAIAALDGGGRLVAVVEPVEEGALRPVLVIAPDGRS
ncbi:tRNA pseudouridine(55) synthase TruB [Brachybacterium huguangmaarense]